MITRRKSKLGEGELVEGDPEVGSRRRTTRGEDMAKEGRGDHPFGFDAGFMDAFMTLRVMVEEMYRQFKKEKGEDPRTKDEKG